MLPESQRESRRRDEKAVRDKSRASRRLAVSRSDRDVLLELCSVSIRLVLGEIRQGHSQLDYTTTTRWHHGHIVYNDSEPLLQTIDAVDHVALVAGLNHRLLHIQTDDTLLTTIVLFVIFRWRINARGGC